METQTVATPDERAALLREHEGYSTESQPHCIQNSSNGEDEPVTQATIASSKMKLVATAFDFWVTGVAMAALGILIPDIEHYYDIDDATVSFMFPASIIGYLVATATVQPISSRLGLRGIAVLSPALRLVAALVLMIGPAFPIILVTSVFFGYGTGLTDISWNAWASRMAQPNIAQGLLHGSFSVGCVLGPIISVTVLREHMWYMLYSVIALFVLVGLLLQSWAFRHDTSSKHRSTTETNAESTNLSSLLRGKLIWLCSLYFFLYQAVEACFTDWIFVYMRRVRHIEPATAGYSSSVFWMGMAVGRYALGPASERFGVSRSVAAYIVIAIGLEAALGLQRDTVATFAFLGLVGCMLAPLYPSGIVVLTSRVPARAQLTLVAIAMAIGQLGGAAAPVGVGFMATRLGMQHLLQVVGALSVLMMLSWIAFIKLT